MKRTLCAIGLLVVLAGCKPEKEDPYLMYLGLIFMVQNTLSDSYCHQSFSRGTLLTSGSALSQDVGASRYYRIPSNPPNGVRFTLTVTGACAISRTYFYCADSLNGGLQASATDAPNLSCSDSNDSNLQYISGMGTSEICDATFSVGTHQHVIVGYAGGSGNCTFTIQGINL